MGIELGLQVYAKEQVLAESRGPWDFIIGSIHRMGDYVVDRGYIMSGKSKHNYISAYFTALAEAVEELPCFDVLGHIDLFRRGRGFY